MSTKPQEDHALIRLSDHFRIAHQKVDYHNYDALEQRIRDSVFTFDRYFNSITNLNRKFEWLSIRSLLLELGAKYDISYDEHGKPHFKNSSSHLSISHSNNHVAVSLHKTEAHGIDLQFLTPKIKRIKNKFLKQNEFDQLTEISTKELTILWSMKEALFKLYGKKDIFLKNNIEISSLKIKDNKACANGVISHLSHHIEVEMEAILIGDYVLAYTLIP